LCKVVGKGRVSGINLFFKAKRKKKTKKNQQRFFPMGQVQHLKSLH